MPILVLIVNQVAILVAFTKSFILLKVCVMLLRVSANNVLVLLLVGAFMNLLLKHQ